LQDFSFPVKLNYQQAAQNFVYAEFASIKIDYYKKPFIIVGILLSWVSDNNDIDIVR